MHRKLFWNIVKVYIQHNEKIINKSGNTVERWNVNTNNGRVVSFFEKFAFAKKYL